MKPSAGEFFVGLDLGQKRDFTTLAVVERLCSSLPCFHLRYLERLNLNTSYPAVAERVRDLFAKVALRGKTTLVMDVTGVGVPVYDLLHARGVRPVAVTITGGRSISGIGSQLRVPKGTLIGTLAKLFETGRLKLAAGIPNAAELIEELLNMQVKIHRRTRQESYGAKGSQKHDDLVLALALAVWYAEKANS